MWFQELFGFEEETPEQVRENLVLRGEVLHSNVNGRSFQCAPILTRPAPLVPFRMSNVLLSHPMAARRRGETSGGLKGLKGGLLHETKAAITKSWRSIYLARTILLEDPRP